MAAKEYLVASDEGANHTGIEVGETVILDLEPERELALVAAGWLEPNKAATPKKKEN